MPTINLIPMRISVFIGFLLSLFSCSSKTETCRPEQASISESVYASGSIKSRNQYDVYSTVNGIVEQIFVSEGDTLLKGQPILSISNTVQRINTENAALAADLANLSANQGKLNTANMQTGVALAKMRNDSAMFERQKNLWAQHIGSKTELESKELAYQQAQSAYLSARVAYEDLQRQLRFNASQSQKNLQLSHQLQNDYVIKSEMDGLVYNITKSKGDLVGPQTLLAVVGDARNFLLEMQVDEYDILRIKNGLPVLVTLDSYKGQVFEARVSKINPIMNERSKTFLVEAEFLQNPKVLYPNITFEANIVIQTRKNVLLLPRIYVLRDSLVIKSNGDTVAIRTGLKDYKKIEVLSGISAQDELQKPAP
jgi:HlyD family secretion protein